MSSAYERGVLLGLLAFVGIGVVLSIPSAPETSTARVEVEEACLMSRMHWRLQWMLPLRRAENGGEAPDPQCRERTRAGLPCSRSASRL